MVVLTPLADNLMVWLITIKYGEEILRYSTAETIITDVDNNIYSPDLLIRDSFRSFSRDTDTDDGGSLGSIAQANFTFSGEKFLDSLGSELETEASEDILTEDDQLINEQLSKKFNNAWYPSPYAPNLIGAEVKIGFQWLNGTELNDSIIWVYYGNIKSAEITPSLIDLKTFEESDFEFIQLPFYEVQKDFDDGISYFPKAPEDSLGSAIPILYADEIFRNNDWFSEDDFGFPIINIDQSAPRYILFAHPSPDVDIMISQFSSTFDEILYLMNHVSGMNATGNKFGAFVFNNDTNWYYKTYLKPKLKVIDSALNSAYDVDTLFDSDDSTYVELLLDGWATEHIAFKFDNKDTEGAFILSSPRDATYDTQIYFDWVMQGSGDGEIMIDVFRMPVYDGFNSLTLAYSSAESSHAWMILDGSLLFTQFPDMASVLDWRFRIWNKTSGQTVKIKEVRIEFKRVALSGITKNIRQYLPIPRGEKKGSGRSRQQTELRNTGNGRSFPKDFGIIKNIISSNFGYANGRIERDWS